MPPTLVDTFKELTSLDSLDVIRMPTTRPELIISVQVCPIPSPDVKLA
jgi:hypothetical protein